MINVLISLLAFIFMLGLIVIIHELGHFLAARAFGIHCHEFSIGMGPAIYQRKGKNTIFSIRAIPLGGYVSIASDTGEYPEAEEAEDDAREVVDADYSEASDELKQEIPVLSDDKTKEKEADEEEDWNAKVPPEQKLDHRPAWQQVIVLLAGVTMNIVLALCLMAVFIGARGYVPMPTEPVVAEVFENSPRRKAVCSQAIASSKLRPKTAAQLNQKNSMMLRSFSSTITANPSTPYCGTIRKWN
ncbi:site-2 protease family protein [Allobaculum sp. Allo2]|uniref:site-2 protease family protein n=1 Tax=Allobaculum sp. Allo2 TaxID=2853432 RepID=UPI0021133B28|nr:site-2 protease family protein [Allobaculum sp. Allo2]UNT94212.1 site-2 protease family protein [Allobaculum sp. Allo2]